MECVNIMHNAFGFLPPCSNQMSNNYVFYYILYCIKQIGVGGKKLIKEIGVGRGKKLVG